MKLQIQKWTLYYCVFQNVKNDPFCGFKSLRSNFFVDLPSQRAFVTNFWKKISTRLFFSKNFKNIWIEIFKNIENFESSNYDFRADFGKLSFFVKPKWFHGGFKFINLKPPLTQGGFKWFWRFFFFYAKFQAPKKTKFWPKFTICWVSRILWFQNWHKRWFHWDLGFRWLRRPKASTATEYPKSQWIPPFSLNFWIPNIREYHRFSV